jgi:hypothetical protein
MLVFVAGLGVTDARAQALWGFSQPYSPFLAMPWVQGEVRVTPIWMQVISGKNTVSAAGQSWDLRKSFNLTNGNLFVDVMGRLQIGRLSFRVQGEQRDFMGSATYQNLPGRVKVQPRLEFSGCRVGLDLDLFCRNGIRAGVSTDYYWYNPIFTESVWTDGGKKLLGENPLTWGIYTSVTLPRDLWGAWPVFEARVSWPITIYTSPEITDLNIAAGLRGPGTILGNLAVRGGYRRTSLSFTDAQIFNNFATRSKIDVVLSGWFGELVYYY